MAKFIFDYMHSIRIYRRSVGLEGDVFWDRSCWYVQG